MHKETMNPLVEKSGDKHNSPSFHAEQNMQDRTPLWVSILAIVIAMSSLTLLLADRARMTDKIVAAERENARLNTLVLNHTDKLDDDTIIAQGLLTAANAALAGKCK